MNFTVGPPGLLAARFPRSPTSLTSWSMRVSNTAWSEKGVRLAQKMQVGPCIPVGTQLYKAEIGPTSGPTWLLSHLVLVLGLVEAIVYARPQYQPEPALRSNESSCASIRKQELPPRFPAAAAHLRLVSLLAE